MSPMAAADVTETQFSGGSTSYTHTFTGTGDGFAGNLTFPYGAEVHQQHSILQVNHPQQLGKFDVQILTLAEQERVLERYTTWFWLWKQTQILRLVNDQVQLGW